MECQVCRARSSVNNCAVCHGLLCEVCGQHCRKCGAFVCPGHGQRVREGGVVCALCVDRARGRNAPAAGPAASAPQPPPEPAASGGLSFAALAADMEELPRPLPERRPEEEAPAPDGMGSPTRRPGLAPEEQNFRVLTASSPKATPYWLTALFTGGMACILLLPLFSAPGFRQQTQPWMSYCVLLLSAGTLVWSFSGLAKEGPSRDRWLCLIGLALALVAGIGAWLLRSPGTPYG